MDDPNTERVVIVDNCGPSPARCLYYAGMVHNVTPEEAQWLFDGQYAYREGEEPILSYALRKEQERIEQERLAAEDCEARAERVREIRAARKEALQQASIAAANSSELAAAREARKAEQLAQQATLAAEQEAHAAEVIATRQAVEDAKQFQSIWGMTKEEKEAQIAEREAAKQRELADA